MAELNGFRRRRIVWRYVMRNAMAPSVVVIAQVAAFLVAGIIITENVFNYPGVGRLLVDAVKNRDVTLVEDVAMILATLYVLLNIARRPDRRVPDPKLRTARDVSAPAATPAPRATTARARSDWRCSSAVLLVALARPARRAARSVHADRAAGRAAELRRAARHRRPRARRAEPCAARGPHRDRSRTRGGRRSPTSAGLTIGLAAGYSRRTARRVPDARHGRAARLPAAAVRARARHGRRHQRRRPDRGRRPRADARHQPHRPRRHARGVGARLRRGCRRARRARPRRFSAARSCPTSPRPCSPTSACASPTRSSSSRA